MIVGVLTTCHTQYTWDRSICIFVFNRTTLQVLVTYRTGALYVHRLWFYKHQHDNRVRSMFVACQRWWFQRRFWFVPSVPGYLREEEEHKPDPWCNPIERNHVGLHLENEVVKTPTIILNKPVFGSGNRVVFTVGMYRLKIFFPLRPSLRNRGEHVRPSVTRCRQLNLLWDIVNWGIGIGGFLKKEFLNKPWVSWKSTQWQSRRRKRISTRNFHISWPIWMKFGV